MPIINGIEDSQRIDAADTLGLNGVPKSLAYRMHELEDHFHNTGHAYGRSGVDGFLLENSLLQWQVTAGAGGAFGNWLQLSNGDEITDPYYDPRKVQITQASAAGNLYYFQFGTGAAGSQTAITTFDFFPAATLRQVPVDFTCPRVENTALLWARICCETDGATASFVINAHHYEG